MHSHLGDIEEVYFFFRPLHCLSIEADPLGFQMTDDRVGRQGWLQFNLGESSL